MRLFLEEIKCGNSCGQIGCGCRVVAVKYNDGTDEKWLSNSDFFGNPLFCLSEKDPFERLTHDDCSFEFIKFLDDRQITTFNGIDVTEYDKTYEDFRRHAENPAIPLLLFIIALTDCPAETADDLIHGAVGRYADELLSVNIA